MQLVNNIKGYGFIAIFLHWLMAILIIGLFVLGEYMVDLTYYDAWYIKAPDLHRSTGILLGGLLLFRLVWRLMNTYPDGIGKAWEQWVAIAVHRSFYLLLVVIVVSGYLISTADGQAIAVFDFFTVPATVYGLENQADIAGEVHEWSTHIMIILLVLHSLAALKHHFINHDATLRRILSCK
ncbi:MAG: cytochrome b [Methylococcales bacterium]